MNAWPTYEIYPDSPWNYALKLDDAAPEENLIVEKGNGLRMISIYNTECPVSYKGQRAESSFLENR